MKTYMLLLFALCASLSAQITHPNPWQTVGGPQDGYQINDWPGVETENYDGETRVGAHVAFGDRSSYSSGTAAWLIKVGKRLWWWADSMKVGVSPVEFADSNTTVIVMGICVVPSGGLPGVTFPGSAVDWDQIFLDPSTAVLLSPYSVQSGQTNGGGTDQPAAVVSSAGYDRFWSYFDIPNNSALIGTELAMQNIRLDANGAFYLSSTWIVGIGQ